MSLEKRIQNVLFEIMQVFIVKSVRVNFHHHHWNKLPDAASVNQQSAKRSASDWRYFACRIQAATAQSCNACWKEWDFPRTSYRYASPACEIFFVLIKRKKERIGFIIWFLVNIKSPLRSEQLVAFQLFRLLFDAFPACGRKNASRASSTASGKPTHLK